METKALKKQMGAAIAMVLVAAIALAASTYAWFVNSTKVTAGTAEVSATTANTLLIKNADGQWATSYALTDQNTNFVPVSTIGKNTTENFDFFVQNDWAKDTSDAITVNKAAAATGNEYWSKEFEIKASQACKLYLDKDTVFTATGASNTMNKVLRLALVVSKSDGTYQKTVFYQIDPDTNTGNTYNTTLEALAADGIQKAISGLGDNGNSIAAKPIVSPATKALAGANAALAIADPDNGLSATVGTADELYSFTQNNEVVKIKAYIWMEGCDYDCNNNTVNEITGVNNKVTATLGFCAGATTA